MLNKIHNTIRKLFNRPTITTVDDYDFDLLAEPLPQQEA